MEKALIKKVDVMINRCTKKSPKRDALIIMEGGEGEGKTTLALLTAYYIKYHTKRPINLFFRLEDVIKFAQNTEKQIIIWDEPALDSLSTDSLNKLNKNLIRLIMAVRKKQHFFILNFTKFYKFSEYIIVDRALALIHVYSRKEIHMGHFVYIKRRNLERLYNTYRTSRKRLYKTLSKTRYGGFRGTFRDIFDNNLFDKMGVTVNGVSNASVEVYDKEKDKAIASIGIEEKENKKESMYKDKVRELQMKIGRLKPPFKVDTQEDYANKLGIHRRTLINWVNYAEFHDKNVQKP